MSIQSETFIDLLIAAMKDACIESTVRTLMPDGKKWMETKQRRITQLQALFDPFENGKMEKVRIIIIPEKLDFTAPDYAPLGTPHG